MWSVIPNTHEAIISEGTFQKSQRLQGKYIKTAPGARKAHIFSGLVRCADCQKAMHRRSAKGYVYYACYACRMYEGKGGCSKHTIWEDRLEEVLRKTIQMLLRCLKGCSALIEKIRLAPEKEWDVSDLYKNLERNERALQQKTDAADLLYLDWKQGEINKEEYHRLRKRLSEQEGILQQRINALRSEVEQQSRKQGEGNPCLHKFLEHGTILELPRPLLLELVNTVWIHNNGEMTIEFKIEDSFTDAQVEDVAEKERQAMPVVQFSKAPWVRLGQ